MRSELIKNGCLSQFKTSLKTILKIMIILSLISKTELTFDGIICHQNVNEIIKIH